MSQETLATMARVSSGYLSKLERGGYHEPSIEILTRIASALSMPVADLLKETGLEHLLPQADPSLETLLESYSSKVRDLPRRDRDLIMTEIQRIVRDETEQPGNGNGHGDGNGNGNGGAGVSGNGHAAARHIVSGPGDEPAGGTANGAAP